MAYRHERPRIVTSDLESLKAAVDAMLREPEEGAPDQN
jgi:hypothetical protein